MVEFLTEFTDNRQPRCPCILLLDTSGSMEGEPLRLLGEGIKAFKDELTEDPLARKRVEVSIVTFPPVRTVVDFCTPDAFVPPALTATGQTPLGEAVRYALAQCEARKASYRAHHVEYFRPWIFLITDGAPTDAWQGAAAKAKQAETEGHLAFFAVGVPGADMSVLSEFSKRPPAGLNDLRFREMFIWLTASLKAVAGSNSHSGGDPAATPSLHVPGSWADL